MGFRKTRKQEVRYDNTTIDNPWWCRPRDHRVLAAALEGPELL